MKTTIIAAVFLSISALTAAAGGVSLSATTDFKGNTTATVTVKVLEW